MFDRTVVLPANGRHYHNHNTIVTEKRAPTDESVRLLHEMEEAARDKLLDSIKVGDTQFECVVHAMKMFESGELMLRAVFSLNGSKHTAEASLSEFETMGSRLDVARLACDKLVSAVAHKIAEVVVRPALLPILEKHVR